MARGTVDDAAVGRRMDMAHAAADALGGMTVRMAGFPDNRLDSVDMLDLAQVVEGEIEACNPDLVYTHHAGDLNVDHRRAHQAVMTACRPIQGRTVREIRCFEVPSSTEWAGPGLGPSFEPTLFIGLDAKALAAKREAFDAYAAEMRDPPHPRSWDAVSALATLRGAAAGFAHAEAFTVPRRLVP
jgi:LmbE family N-acetylglucosaminyl deacetylase